MIEDIPNTSENLTSINEDTLENGVFEKWNNLKKDITIGVVTYSQNYLLKTLINSFQSQNSDNWKMIIIHDGPINKDLYRSLIANKYLTDERILLVTSEGRYDDYGHGQGLDSGLFGVGNALNSTLCAGRFCTYAGRFGRVGP